MANCTPGSPVIAERCNNSTPKRVQLFSPVRRAHSAHIGEKQQTPLSQIQRFVHSGVQLLANTPGKSLHTPEYGSATRLTVKDGRTHFLSPLSVSSNIQVSMTCTSTAAISCCGHCFGIVDNMSDNDGITRKVYLSSYVSYIKRFQMYTSLRYHITTLELCSMLTKAVGTWQIAVISTDLC